MDWYRVSECAVRVKGVADDFYRDEVGFERGLCAESVIVFVIH